MGNYKVRVAYNSLDDNYLLHAEPRVFGTGYDKTITLALSKAEATEIWRSLNRHFGTVPEEKSGLHYYGSSSLTCNCKACKPITETTNFQSYSSLPQTPKLTDITVAYPELRKQDTDKVEVSRKATRARLNVVLDELIDLKRSLG